MRSLPVGCRSSQYVRPIPYTIATPAQTSANRTGWSLKKCISLLVSQSSTPRGLLQRADLRDRGEEKLAQLLVVLGEDADHFVMRDRRRPLDPDVVIRDHRDVRVAELE